MRRLHGEQEKENGDHPGTACAAEESFRKFVEEIAGICRVGIAVGGHVATIGSVSIHLSYLPV